MDEITSCGECHRMIAREHGYCLMPSEDEEEEQNPLCYPCFDRYMLSGWADSSSQSDSSSERTKEESVKEKEGKRVQKGAGSFKTRVRKTLTMKPKSKSVASGSLQGARLRKLNDFPSLPKSIIRSRSLRGIAASPSFQTKLPDFGGVPVMAMTTLKRLSKKLGVDVMDLLSLAKGITFVPPERPNRTQSTSPSSFARMRQQAKDIGNIIDEETEEDTAIGDSSVDTEEDEVEESTEETDSIERTDLVHLTSRRRIPPPRVRLRHTRSTVMAINDDDDDDEI